MMTRKFKLAGVLMAVACAFAVTASLASATFTSAGYPATGSGTTTGDMIDAFGASLKCTENSFQIASISGPTETLTVTPSYKKCSAFGVPMTVNTTGCDVLAHNGSGKAVAVDMICPEGVQGMNMAVYSNATHTTVFCQATLHKFTNKEGLSANSSGGNVIVEGTLLNLTMTISDRTSIVCPAGPETKEARYTVQPGGATIKGSNGAISLS